MEALITTIMGLFSVWVVLSIATMEIQNFLITQQGLHAISLKQEINDILNDPKLIANFYNHSLIQLLSPKDKNNLFKRPSDIPENVFAEVFFDTIVYSNLSADEVKESLSLELIRKRLKNYELRNPSLSRILNSLFPNLDRPANFEAKISECKANIEKMYKNSMINRSRKNRDILAKISFIIGLIISIIFNIDAINIAKSLWQYPILNAVIVAQAQNQTIANLSQSEIITLTKDLNFPIGWTTSLAKNQACGLIGFENNQLVIQSGEECRVLTSMPNSLLGLFYKLFGFILSSSAASQGAPFWFDLLRKLVKISSSQSKVENS